MAAKLHHNAILTGILDSFCLACETYLRSEEDASRHIAKPVHKKSLQRTQFLEKFKTDHIRKVKMGYYCEFCNILFSTVTKIGIHVADGEHIATKGLLLLKSQKNGVVAYNDTLIKEKAWHGLTEDSCAICNTEFENAEIHKNSTTHLLKLVQHKVEFGANNSVYRRMDESTFQCLTCNIVLALNTLENHFNDPNHQDVYLKCRIEQNSTSDEDQVPNKINDIENMQNIKINEPKVPIVTKTEIKDEEKQPDQLKMNSKKTETDNKSKILDAVSRFEKSEININFEFETAFCKKCFVSISFNFHDIERHVVEHKTVNKSASHPSNVNQKHNKIKLMDNREAPKYTQQPEEVVKALRACETATDQNHNKINAEDEMETIFTNEARSRDDNTTDDDEEIIDLLESDENDEMVKEQNIDVETVIKFANENHITYNANNNNAFCRVCHKRLPSSLRSMKEHVSGMPHKSRVASQDSFTANTKLRKKTSKNFIDEVIVVGNFFQQDVVVNGKYFISNLSFLMISKHGSRLRCQVCEISLTNDEVDDHEESYTHKKAMYAKPVVTYYDSEFVREIRPGLFHCGYCNLIAGSWSDFEKHIKCPEHKASKDTASSRLEMHMPRIIAHRRQKEMEFLRMMMLGQFGRLF